jgi:glycosyltransferase involved in cell wall biosynthesis
MNVKDNNRSILFFISSLSFGGAEKQTVMDANLLSKDNNVYLVTFFDGPQLKLLNEKVNYIKLNKRGYLQTARQLAVICKENKIYIIHASLFAACTISALSSLISKIPVIWHFHSHEYDIPQKSCLAFRLLAKLPSVKKILFVNHELMEHFSGFNFPKKKQGVLYNHSTIDSAVVQQKTKEDDIINIGYLGRVIGLKRLEYLVSLASYLLSKKVLNFRIHIVGDGESMPDLIKSVGATGVEEHFLFHGFQADVQRYYQLFEIFVNPSSEECLSIAMIDAGMMALPIVAFDVGGNNEIVLNNQTGYIVQSKKEFFRKVFTVIRNKSLRLEMGQKACSHCAAKFSEEAHLVKIQSLYKEVLG